MMKYLSLLVVLCGCSQPAVIQVRESLTLSIEPKPNQAEAVDIIWRVYAEYDDTSVAFRVPPTVGWMSAEYFPCGDYFCYGVYIPKHHIAVVSWGKMTKKYHETSLAHELCHAWFRDPTHVICHNGLPPIETANLALQAHGF